MQGQIGLKLAQDAGTEGGLVHGEGADHRTYSSALRQPRDAVWARARFDSSYRVGATGLSANVRCTRSTSSFGLKGFVR